MRLSRQLGMTHGELLDRMTREELLEQIAYERLNPEPSIPHMFALIMSALTGERPTKFLPQPEQSIEDTKARFFALAAPT
ncbi:hypothetical protein GC163_13275 [bacterium]|nr:hypothetical protein [bacterium]